MNRLLAFLLLFTFISLTTIQAQTFPRAFEIKEPSGLEIVYGGIIAGVDYDEDGLPEFYAVNGQTDVNLYDLTPRIYKYEWNPTTTSWDSVWGAVAPSNIVNAQNTWPAFAVGDLDKDNKPELYWGIVNNFASLLNPARILVYEYPGDGSDAMGVADGVGGYLPNATTSLTTYDSYNIRPIRFVVADPDNDGTDELIFADRASSDTSFHVGVLSVSDVPDNGGGLEVWTSEFNGVGDINLTSTGAKWDLAVLNNYIYLFDGNLTNGSKVWGVRYVGGVWESLPGQSGIAGGNSSFKGAQTVDINKDGTKEIIVAEWLGNAIGQGARVWLLQQSGDTLTSSLVANLESLGAVRLVGSGFGDLDSDGNFDFVCASRYEANNTAKVPVFRIEYQGGSISDSLNYTSTLLDSGYWTKNGDLDVICVANVDGDTDDEVFYTQGYTRGNSTDAPMPIILLDQVVTPVSVELESNQIPSQFFLNQNFPNPFNPSTQIKFGITEAANVDLRIYDILGSEVAVVINNQYLAAGSYSTKFDAANLASGIYIYKLTAGANTVSKKMQLLK